MSECTIERGCTIAPTVASKLEAFDFAINMSDQFEIIGLDETETKFVLKDAFKSEGVEGRYIEIDIKEVIQKSLTDILAVIVDERNDIICKGYTRIVGYYSATVNWSKSKVGELRDRAKGQYGTGEFQSENQEERLATIDSLSVLNR